MSFNQSYSTFYVSTYVFLITYPTLNDIDYLNDLKEKNEKRGGNFTHKMKKRGEGEEKSFFGELDGVIPQSFLI
jgi:hypothetical protein